MTSIRARWARAVEPAVGHPRHVALAALAAGLVSGPVSRPLALALAVAAAAALAAADAPPGLVLLAVALVIGGAIGAHARLAALDRTAFGARPGGLFSGV